MADCAEEKYKTDTLPLNSPLRTADLGYFLSAGNHQSIMSGLQTGIIRIDDIDKQPAEIRNKLISQLINEFKSEPCSGKLGQAIVNLIKDFEA